jgi:hypothetical protein
MEIIKKGKTPDGTRIQLEDHTDGIRAEIILAAFPQAVKEDCDRRIEAGNCFRVQFAGLQSRSAIEFFGALLSGTLTLSDLRIWFPNKRDARCLGMH